ncbi:MAG: hypothetical protein M3Z01_09560 [Thermoproteota archaeon]|nr:hypothetical protein [Thermoproteota archaeon]
MVYKKLIILTAILTLSISYFSIAYITFEGDFIIIQSAFAQNTTSNGENNDTSAIVDTLSSDTKAQTTNVEYNMYNNSKWGIKIEVPSTWVYNEENAQVLFLSPTDNISSNNGGYRTVSTLGIGIENVATNSNKTSLIQLAINTTKGSLTNFHLDNSNTTMLAGSPANEIIYSGKTPTGNDAKGLIVWKAKDTKLHSITYSVVTSGPSSAASREFERQLPVINHMIESFEITK